MKLRFIWQRRADEEQRLRITAEKRLATARSNWPVIQEHANELRRQRELNGWTGIVASLFADSGRGGVS